jgi:lysyl-tRNA synthetase class 1
VAPASDRDLFWADAEARSLRPDVPHVIRDSKTPSGPVPVSGLRGPVITDALYRTFRSHGLAVRFVYTIDDYDPMDSQSMRERAEMAPHMGKPLCAIPTPEPGATDFADYHATRFIATFERLGIRPEFHRMRDLYRDGSLDGAIDLVLRHAAAIRQIYARVSNVHKDADWLPVSVICEQCGRLGTTYASDYDGATVAYECRGGYVEWAEGCGNRGRMSPFGGNSKLQWNIQWPAVWDLFGVTYEEGGKDLLTAGGSRDRADAIYREVWGKEPPPGLVHEFLTLGGRKMSTSGGIGELAHELVSAYPPELVRFLMIRTHPKRHIDFDPGGMRLPQLFDDYDRCAEAYRADPESDLGKVWALSQPAEGARPIECVIRFSLVADWVQIPSVDAFAEARKRKGAPLTEEEGADLDRRLALARTWLERWAPDEARFTVTQRLPDAARTLSQAQRAYLRRVAAEVGRTDDPDATQAALYAAAKELGLVTPAGKVSQDAFAALYRSLIGKPNGPRAGWLVTTLDPAFVRRRLHEAADAAGSEPGAA